MEPLCTSPKSSNPSCKTPSSPGIFPAIVKGLPNSPPDSPSPEKALFSLNTAIIRGAGAADIESSVGSHPAGIVGEEWKGSICQEEKHGPAIATSGNDL